MFRFPSVICTRCTGFFCLAIIKGPPNDIYCIIEEPYKHYFTEKVSYSHQIHTPFLHIVIILSESFQQCFPDSSFQTDTLVSHTQSQPKLES